MMTALEARERAEKIWGQGQVKLCKRTHGNRWAAAHPPPGEAEWDVTLFNGSQHDFDCNGHPTCHKTCDDISVEVA